MGTFLFDKTIFGPVYSRRLGVSLGINLLPNDCKICNYNCIYCECGWSKLSPQKNSGFNSLTDISIALETKLAEMKDANQAIDMITFAGNGEPTLHPDFAIIVDTTIKLRNKYFPDVLIAILTNGTRVADKGVFSALNLVDRNMLKLDSGIDETFHILNQPLKNISLRKLVDSYKKFDNNIIIQSMFVKGPVDNGYVDNTTSLEINSWLKLIKEINPGEVMVYTIARDTPTTGLVKITRDKLEEIASIVESAGFKASVYE